MKYHFKVHKEDQGFWAECIEFPGCVTQAETEVTLFLHMQEALNLYVDEPADSKELISLPDHTVKKSKNIVEVQLDPKLSYLLLVSRILLIVSFLILLILLNSSSYLLKI